MSRSDDERIADIVEAAAEIAAVVDRGKTVGADVVGLRTLRAHHYHRVDPEQAWVIASVDVPRLVLALS